MEKEQNISQNNFFSINKYINYIILFYNDKVLNLLYRKDGTIKYEGEFVNGQYEGKGKLYYKSGKIMHEGIFEKGKFISE